MNKYQLFCHQLVQGKLPHRREYYMLKSDDLNSDNTNADSEKIQVISPTQSSVEKARSEVEKEGINSDVISDLYQSGGSGSKSGSSKKKKSGKRKGSSKGVSKKKNKSKKPKTKKKNPKKRVKFNKNHSKWM